VKSLVIELLVLAALTAALAWRVGRDDDCVQGDRLSVPVDILGTN
jgi:hypothetical protein